MAYLKLMMDEKEIAHLSEDGQSLCANEDVPQYNLPLNLFIGDKRKVPLVDVVVWAKKRIFPKNRMDCKEILKLMGLPDYNAWEIVKRTNACLMEDPYWLCDSAKMRPLRTPRADEPKKSWTKLRKTADTNWYQLTSIAKPTGWTHIPACGL